MNQFIFPLFLIFYFCLASEEKSISVESLYELRGLENEFQEVFSLDLDLKSSNKKAYLEPNERGVTQAKLFLKLDEPSLLVTVGGERSFFDLILCVQSSGENCLGLVVRDVHPKIKAYLDYAVMLLRISSDCIEFEKLASSPTANEQEGDARFRVNRIEYLRERIARSDLPYIVQDYYQRNLESYFSIYHEESKRFWLLPSSEELISYHKDKESFAILQNYAKEGKIIVSLGDINDLEFLSDRKIGVIDISNIPSFAMTDFYSNHQSFQPRVIWTTFKNPSDTGINTNYYSFVYKKLSEEERDEVDKLLLLIGKSYTHRWKKFHYAMISLSVRKILQLDHLDCCPSYSEQFLLLLRLSKQKMNRKEMI